MEKSSLTNLIKEEVSPSSVAQLNFWFNHWPDCAESHGRVSCFDVLGLWLGGAWIVKVQTGSTCSTTTLFLIFNMISKVGYCFVCIVRQDCPKWFDVIRHLRISCMHWGLLLLQSGRKIWSSLARATPLQSVCLHGQPTALDIKCFLLCNSATYMARPLDPGMALWTHQILYQRISRLVCKTVMTKCYPDVRRKSSFAQSFPHVSHLFTPIHTKTADTRRWNI